MNTAIFLRQFLKCFFFLGILIFVHLPPAYANSLDSLANLLDHTADQEERIQLQCWIYILEKSQGKRITTPLDLSLADSLQESFSSPETRFAYLITKGLQVGYTGDLRVAFSYFDAADSMRHEVKPLSEANFLSTFSSWLTKVDDTQVALNYVNRALFLQDSLNNREGLAAAYRHKGGVLNALSDFKRQLEAFFEALKLYREIGDANGEAWTLLWLEKYYSENSDYETCAKYISEITDIKDRITANWLKVTAEDEEIINRFLQQLDGVDDSEIWNLINKEGTETYRLISLYSALNMGYRDRKQYEKSYTVLLAMDSLLYVSEQTTDNPTHSVHKGINRFRAGDYDQAMVHFKDVLNSHSQLDLPEEYMEASKGMAQSWVAQGQYQKAASHFNMALKLTDSLFSVRNTQAIANMEIAYESQKKQFEISQLRNKNELQNLEIKRKSLVQNGLIALAILLLALLATIILLLRSRQKLNLERIRSRISTDLHDDVGGILAGLAMQTEIAKANPSQMDAAAIARIAETARKAMGRMRDIVWVIDRSKTSFQDLLDRMYEHANETMEAVDIDFELEHSGIAPSKILSAEQRQHLYLIFKESLTNAAKYSGATTLVTRLHNMETHCILTIEDNGEGFSEDRHQAGNGLNNMNSRAEKLKGKLTLNSHPGQGTSIRLEIPRI